MYLLDDRFAPITSEIGFLETDSRSVAEAYLEWVQPIHAKRNVRHLRSEVNGSFAANLQSLLPLTSVERLRFLFLPTKSDWTAYFDNGWRGTDVYSAVSYLCQKLGCRGIRAVASDDINGSKGKLQYGATIFELYSPTTEGCTFINTRRSIYAANDGGKWKFGADGEPQSFENLEQYQAKQIKSRFTREMLDSYLKSFGIEFFDPQFYEGEAPGQLVAKIGATANGLRSYSLEEARLGAVKQ